jgi:hypothetical protein
LGAREIAGPAADISEDSSMFKLELRDPLWTISHFFPKWLTRVVAVLGLWVGIVVAYYFNVKGAIEVCLVAAGVSFAFLVALAVVDKWLFQRMMRDTAPTVPDEDDAGRDGPISFGYKIAWIAVPSRDAHAVAEAMGLERIKPCSWRSGLEKAYKLRGVFVTPPIAEWTVALGNLPEANDSRFVPLMERLSQTFQQAFYFGTHRVVEYQAWAIAEEGKIRRAFAWVGERGEFLLNIGPRTPEEIELATGLEDFERAPDEETVLDLASRWEFDPRELDQQSAESGGPGWFASRKL